MRAFFLIAIAAMAATVSCQQVSVACSNSTSALDTPTVALAESYITKSGCLKLNLDITKTTGENAPCSFDPIESSYSCDCVTTLSNMSSWESAVRYISSGLPCRTGYSVVLKGTRLVNNQSRSVSLGAGHTNADVIAFGGQCNITEMNNILDSGLTEILASLDYFSLNANSSVTGVTWTRADVRIDACDATSSAFKLINASSTTVAPIPINPTPTTSTTTSPPTSSSSSGSGSNSNTSSSGLPTVTPAPTSSSSSTAGGGKNGNSASSSFMAHTATMFAALCVAVAVICTA